MHISKHTLYKNKDHHTIARYPLVVFVWLVCTAWFIPQSIASADPLPQQNELIDVQVSSNGAANVDIKSFANTIVGIELLEAYPNILPKECSQTGILPRHCLDTEVTTEVYHGFIQTAPEGNASLTISGQGYYHLILNIVKVPDEVKDSLAPREFIKGFRTSI